MIRGSMFVTRRLMSSKPHKDTAKALQNAFLRSVKKTDDMSPPSTPQVPPVPEKDVGNVKEEPKVPPKVQPQVKPSTTTESSPFSKILQFIPRITVIGVGGGGCNAVDNMVDRGLSGVEYLSCNTDAQHLTGTKTENRIQLGKTLTQGLGCGANPNAGYVEFSLLPLTVGAVMNMM